jgi:hypothetical protein
VWWAKMGAPFFEEWSVDGVHQRTISGTLESFPPRATGGVPRTLLKSFALDSTDRLWVVTVVPDDDWQTVRSIGAEGAIPRDQYDNYWDSRLDLYSLTDRRHIGHLTWDENAVTLVKKNGDVFVALMEYERPDWPRLMLYEVGVIDPN